MVHVETMVEWAKSMTWKGMHPIVARSRKVSQKGVALSKRAMHAVESRLRLELSGVSRPPDDVVTKINLLLQDISAQLRLR